MTFIVGDKVFKSKRVFYEMMHPGCEKPTCNQVDAYCYHFVPAFQERKRSRNKQAYRDRIGRPFRTYNKATPLTAIGEGDTQREEIIQMLERLREKNA